MVAGLRFFLMLVGAATGVAAQMNPEGAGHAASSSKTSGGTDGP